MNRFFSALLGAMALVAFPANGQGPASVEFDKIGAVWFNSGNAAGMTLTSVASFEAVDVSYHIAEGNYRKYTDGNQKNLAVGAEGASSLGKGKVWGRFSYTNITERDTKYNAMFLNLDEDNPYFVADDQPSWWKKQKYELAAKASTPLYGDRVSFGVETSYFTESGAKQIDPRGYGSEYGIVVKPAAVLKLGRHAAGLALDYEGGNMRMTPINNAYMNSKAAFIMHGLGNSEASLISLMTTGVGQVFDKKNQFGGSIQYGFSSEGLKVLADMYGTYRKWDFSHTPTRPERIGTTLRTDIGGKVQALILDGNLLHRFLADGSMKATDGIEYVQVFNKDYNVQAYETVGQNVKSKYSHTEAELSYDVFRKEGDSFDWTAGASARYYGRDDRYIIPESVFNCGQVYAEGHGRKQFLMKGVSVIAGASAGYCMALDGNYIYSGSSASTVIVTDYFPHELAYRQASWWKAGAEVSLSFAVSSGTSVFIGARAALLRTDNSLLDRRSTATFTTGFIF